jgi:hypothetical protein
VVDVQVCDEDGIDVIGPEARSREFGQQRAAGEAEHVDRPEPVSIRTVLSPERTTKQLNGNSTLPW